MHTAQNLLSEAHALTCQIIDVKDPYRLKFSITKLKYVKKKKKKPKLKTQTSKSLIVDALHSGLEDLKVKQSKIRRRKGEKNKEKEKN